MTTRLDCSTASVGQHAHNGPTEMKGDVMRPMPELTVEELPTADLVPYARNAKLHPDEQVGQIAKSIEEFGFNDPVEVWDNAEGELEIVEGHGRVLAAKRLGLETVPVVRLNHLSDEQRRAYTHVHNQTAMNSGWDYSTLDLELDELDFEFKEYGFDVVDPIALFNGGDDLMSASAIETDEFTVSLTFPKEYEETLKEFIKENGKEPLCAAVLAEVNG